MGMSRRALGAMTGALALGLVAGCGTSPRKESTDRLEWLGELDGVEKAEQTTYPGEPDSPLILLTLTRRISDRAVRELIDTVRRRFDIHDDEYDNGIELDIDGFHARFFPEVSAAEDRDVDRILWLRRDGRATASVYGSSGFVITAPQAMVATVALGFDKVGGHEEGRYTHRVESVDRALAVQWTDCPSLGFALNRDVTQHFADLQKRYPHLAGWLVSPDDRSGVYFGPDDIGLDALRTALASTVDLSDFPKLDLGWGPARAPLRAFRKGLSAPVRTAIDRLIDVPGVSEFRLSEATGTLDAESITVSDRAGYLGVIAALRPVWDSYLPIHLVRKPSPYVGSLGESVFEGSVFDNGARRSVFAAVADLAGVVEAQVGADAALLTMTTDISDAELAAALDAMASLPASFTISLWAGRTAQSRTVGTVTDRRFTAAPPGPYRASRAFVNRVGNAWERTTHS
ncbi:MAG: hypothetical protein WCA46_06695 [Actinocatenispora sp.]